MPNFPEPTQTTGDASDSRIASNPGSAAGGLNLATKPRVWPLFALSAVELVVASVLQGAVAVTLFIMTRDDYGSMQEAARELPTRLLEAPIFVLMLVLSSSSIAAAAFLFGWISAKHQRCSIIDRLGLRWPTISTPSIVGLLLGSVPVLLIAVGAVMLIEKVLPGDESILKLYQNITNGWALRFHRRHRCLTWIRRGTVFPRIFPTPDVAAVSTCGGDWSDIPGLRVVSRGAARHRARHDHGCLVGRDRLAHRLHLAKRLVPRFRQ